jgi:hypothetical protein
MTDPEPEREMPDHDERLLDLDDDVDAYEEDWEPTASSALPPRRRRRLVTPASAVLVAVLIAALGFIGGVEVQKGQADGGGGAAASGVGGAGGAASARAAGGGASVGPGGFAGRGGAQGDATIGSVVNKRGSTLYVKDSDGTTVRVKTSSHPKINRTATASAGAIHPGDTVIVQGTKSSSGTITATQINATSSSAASGLAGLFGGGGGFGTLGGRRGGGAGGAGGGATGGQGNAPQPPGGG